MHCTTISLHTAYKFGVEFTKLLAEGERVVALKFSVETLYRACLSMLSLNQKRSTMFYSKEKFALYPPTIQRQGHINICGILWV